MHSLSKVIWVLLIAAVGKISWHHYVWCHASLPYEPHSFHSHSYILNWGSFLAHIIPTTPSASLISPTHPHSNDSSQSSGVIVQISTQSPLVPTKLPPHPHYMSKTKSKILILGIIHRTCQDPPSQFLLKQHTKAKEDS